MATVSLTIRIDENDKKVIEQLAKKDDRSISYIVNQAIKEFIKENTPDNQWNLYSAFITPLSSPYWALTA